MKGRPTASVEKKWGEDVEIRLKYQEIANGGGKGVSLRRENGEKKLDK